MLGTAVKGKVLLWHMSALKSAQIDEICVWEFGRLGLGLGLGLGDFEALGRKLSPLKPLASSVYGAFSQGKAR